MSLKDSRNDSAYIILGIDFGTTYSGLAFSVNDGSGNKSDATVISSWPGHGNATSQKVPSEFRYIKPDPEPSKKRKRSEMEDSATGTSSATIVFGYELEPGDKRFKCLKLLLEPGQRMPSITSKTYMEDMLRVSGKDPVTAVGDYLTELIKHGKETLIKQLGRAFVEQTRIEIVLTVPAIWSDVAKHATITAARKAGIGENIRMVSEPEAAAVYTLQKDPPKNLKVGDVFIVCDAGGGTTDLVGHEVISLCPLKIKEVTMGTGGCCGGAFTNMRFEEHLAIKLGQVKYRDIVNNNPKGLLATNREFEERVKPRYNPDKPKDFDLPMPGVPDNEHAGISQGFITISAEDLRKIFQPGLNDVADLVQGQVDLVNARGKAVSGIILVGGFGKSDSLYKFLQKRFCTGVSPIQIIQPDHAWTAVVRGAVQCGLQDSARILSRVSRRHYGTVCRCDWDAAKHYGQPKVWDHYDETVTADDQMEWYIRKGQDCSSTEPILMSFYRNFGSNAGNSCSEDLIICNEDNAPSVYHQGKNSATRKICTLRVDLDLVPKSFWKQKKNSVGLVFYRLEYDLGMQIESGRLKFDLRIDGVVYGDVVADFDCN